MVEFYIPVYGLCTILPTNKKEESASDFEAWTEKLFQISEVLKCGKICILV